MLKQSMIALVATGLIFLAVPFAAGQDSSNNQSAATEHRKHHGPPDPAQRTEELTKRLKLSPDQQTKVKEALESQRSQMESLHQDSSLSQDDRRAKMMEIGKSTDQQIRGLLDSTQQKKWDEMQANREQRMHHNHAGPPEADEPAPPPQK